jgi:hypothetical protein
MKTKLLAHILIKIIGLYLLAESLPTTLGYLGQLLKLSEIHTPSFNILGLILSFLMSTLSRLALALLFIFKSKSIAGFLFKGEED